LEVEYEEERKSISQLCKEITAAYSMTTHMETVSSLFLEAAQGWGLGLVDEQLGSGQLLATADGAVKIGVMMVVMFDETILFIVSHNGKDTPYNLKLPKVHGDGGEEGWVELEINNEAVRRFFNLHIFAPILRPGLALPLLSHLSSPLLLNILGYCKVAASPQPCCSVPLLTYATACLGTGAVLYRAGMQDTE
jgi:hypothetical protein